MKDWDEMTQKEQEDAQRKNGRDATLPEVHAFVDGVARDSKKFESLAEKMAAADVEATAKAAAAADVEATAKAAAAADVEATAKAAAAANPDVFLAQAAKMLGITIEELKRKQ